MNYGTGGFGTTASVLIALLRSMTGTKTTEIVYLGIPPAQTDLLVGTIQFMFSDIGTVASLIKAGKERALGVSMPRDSKAIPKSQRSPKTESPVSPETLGRCWWRRPTRRRTLLTS